MGDVATFTGAVGATNETAGRVKLRVDGAAGAIAPGRIVPVEGAVVESPATMATGLAGETSLADRMGRVAEDSIVIYLIVLNFMKIFIKKLFLCECIEMLSFGFSLIFDKDECQQINIY